MEGQRLIPDIGLAMANGLKNTLAVRSIDFDASLRLFGAVMSSVTSRDDAVGATCSRRSIAEFMTTAVTAEVGIVAHQRTTAKDDLARVDAHSEVITEDRIAAEDPRHIPRGTSRTPLSLADLRPKRERHSDHRSFSSTPAGAMTTRCCRARDAPT